MLRTVAGLLLVVAGAAVAGWLLGRRGQVVVATVAWRVAFFIALGVLVLTLPFLRALWWGQLHLWAPLRRDLPFRLEEFAGEGRVKPTSAGGVTGRAALVGALSIGLAALLWLGGLALAPLDTTGTLTLAAGQGVADVRPSGIRRAGASYGFELPHAHVFLGANSHAEGALMQATDPRTGEAGQYVVAPGVARRLGPHRIVLEASSWRRPIRGVRVAVDRPGEPTEMVDLYRGVPVSVGIEQLVAERIEPNFMDSDFAAVLVRRRGPAGESAVWLMPDSPDLMGDHVAGTTALRPVAALLTPTVELRFTRQWVMGWRIAILALLSVGAFLLLLVPHRSWVFRGLPGDYRLTVWSLNAGSSLQAWSEAQVRQSLGPAAYAELESIEDQLASNSQEIA